MIDYAIIYDIFGRILIGNKIVQNGHIMKWMNAWYCDNRASSIGLSWIRNKTTKEHPTLQN